MKTILVAGTWGEKDLRPWWSPDSDFAGMLIEAQANPLRGRRGRPGPREAGIILTPEPFRWSTDLDGVIGENRVWETAGAALTWFAHKHSPGEAVDLVAHSHGGQVAAYALAQGLMVRNLVTVAAPVRRDMLPIWRIGAKNILGKWHHIHSDDQDFWQWMGARFSGWWVVPREMPLPAQNIFEPGKGHSELLDPGLWRERGWAGLITGKG